MLRTDAVGVTFKDKRRRRPIEARLQYGLAGDEMQRVLGTRRDRSTVMFEPDRHVSW